MTEDCTTCQLANWQRIKNGRLHSSGDGRCSWEGWREWKMPKAFYYVGYKDRRTPSPSGGHINRRTPCTDCPMYQPITTPTPPQE